MRNMKDPFTRTASNIVSRVQPFVCGSTDARDGTCRGRLPLYRIRRVNRKPAGGPEWESTKTTSLEMYDDKPADVVVSRSPSSRLYRVRSSVQLSVRPSVRPSSVLPSVRPSVLPSVRPSFRSFNRPSVHPSVQPSVRLSVRPSFLSSVRPLICSSIRASIRPSVRPSVRSFVRLSNSMFVHTFTTVHVLSVHPFIYPYIGPYVRTPSVHNGPLRQTMVAVPIADASRLTGLINRNLERIHVDENLLYMRPTSLLVCACMSIPAGVWAGIYRRVDVLAFVRMNGW